MLQEKKLNIDYVIELLVDEKLLVNRIDKRSKENNDVRDDDNAEVLKKRITVYKKDTLPVLNFYKNTGRLNSIDGMQSIEKVSEEIQKILNQVIVD
jgi:adenylate kinase